ncbi:MAG: glycosyltransferase family 2 protein [Trueperaceae bacterium]|nr:glycosyltransferase family 2 protein [Trueperaceae bacterium]
MSVVVVHYRTPDLLRRCLDRLRAYAPGARLIVVDSSDDARSEDEGLEPLRLGYPDVRFIHTANHSFAHAVNVGLKASDTPFIAHMNADVMVGPDTLPALLGALTAQEDVGMVGPRCFVPGGGWQDQGPLYRRHHVVLDFLDSMAEGTPNTPVGWLSGCLQLLRREVVDRVGGLDTRFRFYNEDMEWCLRLRAAGYRCLLVDTAVLHLGGRSTPAATRFWLEGLRGGYLLSARYQPRSARRLHRWGLELCAYLGGRFAPTPHTRDAWRRLHRRLRSGDLSASPFGPTLNDANPDF